MSKNPPSTDVDKKIVSCSTSTSYVASTSIFVVFFSTCSSSSKSLIKMNVNAGGEKCL